ARRGFSTLLRLTVVHMDNNRKAILNVPVDICQPEGFISEIEKKLHQPGVRTIFAINPEKVMAARKNQELSSALQEADFLIPDGIGIVFGLRMLYGERVSRTTGIMLMECLLKLADEKKLKVFIFGSQPQVNTMASGNIRKRYPSLDLVGTQHGYIPQEEYESLVERVNSLRIDILFVGLGSPKQEKWIQRYKNALRVKICIGIGGSLDVIAGKIPRAPLWLQNLGLEWFYRLVKEPKRIKRMYVLPLFLGYVGWEAVRIRVGSKQ
ncbi:MAG: WecB/TagA/CpsF family glycosyltransferase, partial [Deltaproteobacteria bacterium]